MLDAGLWCSTAPMAPTCQPAPARPAHHAILLAPRSNFAPLELAEFQKLMNSVKRGDIVGVAGETDCRWL